MRYRVHGESANAKLQPKLLGLLEVMNRHLLNAPDGAQAWARDLRYGTYHLGRLTSLASQ